MNFATQLKQAGLTENESKIYQALLKIGPSQAGILSRKTGLHRRVVYDTTERLIQKGIIGYIVENGKRIFQASDPKKILEMLKEKEENILEVLPLMSGLYKKTQEKEFTNFYKGKNGIKTILEDQLATKKTIYILGASPLAYDVLQFYFKWFDKRRKEKKIKTKIIFNKLKNKKIPKIPLSEIKFLPQKYSSPLAINIYGEKIAIILWSKENPLAIIIKNKEISEGYKKYFDLMWGVARKN